MPSKSIHIRFDHETLRHMIDALTAKQIPIPASIHQVVKVCALTGVTSMLANAEWAYETPSYASGQIFRDLDSANQKSSALKSAIHAYEQQADAPATSPLLRAIRKIPTDPWFETLTPEDSVSAEKMINLLTQGILGPEDLIDPMSANPELGKRILRELYFNSLPKDVQDKL